MGGVMTWGEAARAYVLPVGAANGGLASPEAVVIVTELDVGRDEPFVCGTFDQPDWFAIDLAFGRAVLGAVVMVAADHAEPLGGLVGSRDHAG